MFHKLTYLFTCDNRNRGILRLNFDEAALLWQAVRDTSGDILEVGRRHGGSTILLLEAAQESRKVISIDLAPAHAKEANDFFAQEKIVPRLSLVEGDSRQFCSPPVGLLFIDGDHSFEGCAADVVAHWGQLQRISPDTPLLAVFHDAVPNEGAAFLNQINHCPGVAEVCKRLVDFGCARVVNASGSMLVLEKTAEIPLNIFTETFTE
ncbi:class I SAM-dependent methyltransferase [Desulfovibrio cuneatus]|uniref:class I SAM-dependent methyltransferase n=1 Tax=Desulfovibrio cuneatus TaxID=159728 RepID=UPI000481032E|nr:class I SAM-dependent methyltransferase [Desulfovibrio cuneatus]